MQLTLAVLWHLQIFPGNWKGQNSVVLDMGSNSIRSCQESEVQLPIQLNMVGGNKSVKIYPTLGEEITIQDFGYTQSS